MNDSWAETLPKTEQDTCASTLLSAVCLLTAAEQATHSELWVSGIHPNQSGLLVGEANSELGRKWGEGGRTEDIK